jgi:hypothetical protein
VTNVQINGENFKLSTEWTVDEIQLAFSPNPGDAYAWQIIAHDPAGPNAFNVTPGVTINAWTDTLIDIDFDGNTVDPYLAFMLARDVTDTETIFFDISPDQGVLPAATGQVNTVTAPSANTRYFFGVDLDGAGLRLRVFDDFAFNKTYFLDAPNDPGIFVTVFNGGFVQIDDPDFSGIDITQVQTRDSSDTVIHEWYAIDGPVIDRICSPAANTVRFEGRGFLSTPLGAVGYVIPRLLDYTAGPGLNGPSMQYELADGSPDANGWELLTHTDTVLEISNTRFTSEEPSGGPGDFVVTGVAFHDPTATTMYYWEPWGTTFNTPVDGAGGCLGSAPAIVTSVESSTVGVVTVNGSGFLTAADGQPDFVQLIIPSDGSFPFDNPNAAGVVGQPSVSWTDTQIVVDLAAEYGFPGAFAGPAIVTAVQVANGIYDVTYDIADVAVFLPPEPSVTSVSQSGTDEITISGEFFLNATLGDLDNVVVTGSMGTLTFCTTSSPSFPACLPPLAGVGGLSDTSWAVSAPDLIGATITSVTVEDYNGNYSVFFDIAPDLVMV